MNEITADNFNNTIKVFKEYKERQDKQRLKQRMQGLNDFNIFDIMGILPHREDLHTLFISYLLNPEAGHYQGSLFLELFLKHCICEKWLKDNAFAIKGCKVHKEKGKKDIYITDGNNHIIIENKVWARDQWTQIKRYIEDVEGNKYVLYLSPDRRNPSSNSLGDWRIEPKEGKELVRDGERYPFAAISYEDEITDWLIESRKQIANITNLSTGISQYLEVIDKLYGKHKEKVMELEDYLEECLKKEDVKEKEKAEETIKTIQQIYEEYPGYRKRCNEDFWEIVMDSDGMKKLKEEANGWEIDPERKIEGGYQRLLTVKEAKKPGVYFNVEYAGWVRSRANDVGLRYEDYRNLSWSIKFKDGIYDQESEAKFKEFFKDDESLLDPFKKDNEIAKNLEDKFKDKEQLTCKSFQWNHLWRAIIAGDSVVDEIFKHGTIETAPQKINTKLAIEAAAEEFANKLYETFKTFKEPMKKCNEYLRQKEAKK